MGRVLTTLVVVGLVAGMTSAGEVKIALTGDNTTIKFVGAKPQGKHNGGFKKLTGTATYDGKDVTTMQITVDIDMNSTYTDTDKLTNHLKSPDFFDVKNNPSAKFVSSKVEKTADGFNVTGMFTLNGKTKSLTFPAKIEPYTDGLKLSSSFSIDRNDWGITYGKGKINDQVGLTITVVAKK